jgi:catechol 2,3-dioxygenase-like lactoylglutathione lyase family enzyme
VHPDYPVLRAPRGFRVSYSLPPVAIARGRRPLDIACGALAGRVSRGVTRVAESEVVQMAIGESGAAIDVATMLLHTGREASTAAVRSGRKITPAEALRARRDMVYAQHQVGWALDHLCEVDGARWVYDNDQLGAIRRDVMTILLTHHAASRQAAMAPYGRTDLDQLKETHRRVRDAGITGIRQTRHGNALSIYFPDPEGNMVEIYMDTPWYVPQPHSVPIDLSLPNDAIMAQTEKHCRETAGFMPLEEWRAEVERRLHADQYWCNSAIYGASP